MLNAFPNPNPDPDPDPNPHPEPNPDPNPHQVLNAFSFTCGAGVAALAGGARSVTNLDFSESALATGRLNAAANGLPADRFGTLCADALPALR